MRSKNNFNFLLGWIKSYVMSPPLYLSLNHMGHWGTTDDFTTSFLHFSLFYTAFQDMANTRLWCCLPTSSSVNLVFFPISPCLARWFWPDLMKGRHVHTTSVCVSLRWSGSPHVVWLLAWSIYTLSMYHKMNNKVKVITATLKVIGLICWPRTMDWSVDLGH